MFVKFIPESPFLNAFPFAWLPGVSDPGTWLRRLLDALMSIPEVWEKEANGATALLGERSIQRSIDLNGIMDCP
jgi:hypothetical protein